MSITWLVIGLTGVVLVAMSLIAMLVEVAAETARGTDLAAIIRFCLMTSGAALTSAFCIQALVIS